MSFFFNIFNKNHDFNSLSRSVDILHTSVGATGVPDAAKAHFIHSLSLPKGKKALILTPDENSAIKLSENLSSLQKGVYYYPLREITLREVQGISHEFEHIRIGILSKMIKGDYSAIVASCPAACQKTIDKELLASFTTKISVGDSIDLSKFTDELVHMGYSSFDQVDGTSQFSVRGGILDIFSPGYPNPIRIDLWGDTVDSISFFDISTQRHIRNIDSFELLPVSEVIYKNREAFIKKLENMASQQNGKVGTKVKETIFADIDNLENDLPISSKDKYLTVLYNSNGIFDFDYDLLFVCDNTKLREKYKKVESDENKLISELEADGQLWKGAERYSITYDKLKDIYSSSNTIFMSGLASGGFDDALTNFKNFNFQSINPWYGSMSELKDELKEYVNNGYTVFINSGTKQGSKILASDLFDANFNAVYYDELPEEISKGSITVLPKTLTAGFQNFDMKLAVITNSLKSIEKKKSKSQHSLGASIQSLDELNVGDYIVHNIHGIGIFDGITDLTIDNVKKDYIKISYAKGDTLYVPVTQLDSVSRYIGVGSDVRVKINSLDSTEWKKTKAKVTAAVQDMAKELTELYAKRLCVKGFAFSEDTDLQRDFELRFIYEETDDQIKCSEEIKRDMERDIPMDRLLCGDVGVGKTEVALRAAFKCISDSKQCAFLVPTTVLALQHFNTTKSRMENFPINVEMLSRFVPHSKQLEIIKGIKDGSVDMIIGTHRLIGKDVEFKDLGLLIIDEEQRFGVAQKEKLKKRFPNVDVLTLSATPIPRTLNMAMSGIRDMSIIEEGPGDRHPVQTYVLEYDFGVIVDAMLKEMQRGGQCYYLHNDVDTIEHVALRIKKEIPSANVGIAHGQMKEEQLSDVWMALLNGEIDILVCTTIIETGIDVANVNTLIVEDADRLGLAQLHQIRGRVGRSSRRAYAYFTFKRGKIISEDAYRRLEAVREYTEFGSGFKIAMRDLEIRGAGSLLGAQQHGHMEAVGYDMYLKLLESAIKKAKGEDVVEHETECLINLPVTAHIPSDYIKSTPQKLSMYKRIASIQNEDEASDVENELNDRYGEIPSSVLGLIRVALIKNRAQKLGIYEISFKNKQLQFYMENVDLKDVLDVNDIVEGGIQLVPIKEKACISATLTNDAMLQRAEQIVSAFEKVKKGKD